MANLLGSGATWMAGQLKDWAGSPGVYSRRGARSATLTATHRINDYEEIDEEGIATLVKSHDWIFPTADLVIGDEAITPERGDLWQPTAGGTYEVLPVAGRPEFEPHDTGGVMLLVHTKKIAE